MIRTDTLLIISAFLMLAGAAVIATQGTNEALFISLNSDLATLLPDAFWSNMTFVADTLFAVAVIAILASRQPHLFNTGLVLLITGAAFVHGFKFLLEVPRPPAVLDAEMVRIIGPVLKNHSFPSGHSFTALATAGLIMLHTRSLFCAVLVLVIGLIAALSRAAVGAHWPLDILTGGAAGLLFAQFAKALCARYWWLQGEGLQRFSAVLMTITCVALIFHVSRYPDTRILSASTGVIATLFLCGYWWRQLGRLRNRAN